LHFSIFAIILVWMQMIQHGKRLRNLSLVALLLAVTITLFAGCSGQPDATDTAPPGSGESYQIKVVLPDKQVVFLGLSELQILPKVSITAYGKSEEGPTLLSALDLAGVKEFNKVTVVGMLRGRVASGELTLNRSEVTSEVILDFTNRGTAKLSGSQIPEDNWIIDVSEMRVE
jgi:hypothetical protein